MKILKILENHYNISIAWFKFYVASTNITNSEVYSHLNFLNPWNLCCGAMPFKSDMILLLKNIPAVWHHIVSFLLVEKKKHAQKTGEKKRMNKNIKLSIFWCTQNMLCAYCSQGHRRIVDYKTLTWSQKSVSAADQLKSDCPVFKPISTISFSQRKVK